MSQNQSITAPSKPFWKQQSGSAPVVKYLAREPDVEPFEGSDGLDFPAIFDCRVRCAATGQAHSPAAGTLKQELMLGRGLGTADVALTCPGPEFSDPPNSRRVVQPAVDQPTPDHRAGTPNPLPAVDVNDPLVRDLGGDVLKEQIVASVVQPPHVRNRSRQVTHVAAGLLLQRSQMPYIGGQAIARTGEVDDCADAGIHEETDLFRGPLRCS